MKALILTCNTGGGHNACAGALQEAFRSGGDTCDLQDSLGFVSGALSRFLSWGHSAMYRHFPGLFRFGYGFAETHPGLLRQDALVYRLLTGGTDRLRQHISQGGYDAVICTHVFSGLLLSRMLLQEPMDIQTAFVATDYTCSPGAANRQFDWYFIPDPSLAPEFQAQGIPGEKIVASGIPVRQAFCQRADRRAAKHALGLDPNRPHLLVMCGSMGCGPLKKLAALLSSRLRETCQISIVCGTNERLRKDLSRQFRHQPNLRVHGFVKEMSRLMDSADLYLTKPGGLSTSESAAKGLPMVFIDAVAGCEAHNLRFFSRLGGALTASSVPELTDLCADLLENPERLETMSAALLSLSHGDAALQIHSRMCRGHEVTQHDPSH